MTIKRSNVNPQPAEHSDAEPMAVEQAFLDASGVNTLWTKTKGTFAPIESPSFLTSIKMGKKSGTNSNVTACTASGQNSVAVGSGTKAYDLGSFAEGFATTAGATSHGSNNASYRGPHAEGDTTAATGNASHAEGSMSIASGDYSHAEGYNTESSNTATHAEGYATKATAAYTHAEGNSTKATSPYAHAEGFSTTASGNTSHVEGNLCVASGSASHAEGNSAQAVGNTSHAEGSSTRANGAISHAEGSGCIADTNYTHAEGHGTKVYMLASHAEGSQCVAGTSGDGSDTTKVGAHAEGYQTKALGRYSHAEGDNSEAGGDASHAEGNGTARGSYSHAEGLSSVTSGGLCAHAEGSECSASEACAHAEGSTTTASGESSHAEGTSTIASGNSSHAEGKGADATGAYSHAEGQSTAASGNSSHAEGYATQATASYSHSGGTGSVAKSSGSFAHGTNVVAAATNQVVIGKYNTETTGTTNQFIIGKGTSTTSSHSFRVTTTAVYGGTYNSSGADYAEMFEWKDENPGDEDRVGRFVTLEGEKIRLAQPDDDFILGIVSGNPSVVADVHDDQWKGMYMYDIFGRPLYEYVTTPSVTVEEPDPDNPDKTIVVEVVPAEENVKQQVINPDHDNSQMYIPRSERPEWDAVGMLGKLVMIDDGTCLVDGYCKPGKDGVATRSDTKTRFRVMSQIDANHIRVLILPQ